MSDMWQISTDKGPAFDLCTWGRLLGADPELLVEPTVRQSRMASEENVG